MFFEGTEKRAELLIDPTLPSLRDRDGAFWADIVGVAGVRILSRLSNRLCDAYLLSESSLFVFDHRIVLITCGRTRLTAAVLEILDRLPQDALEMLVYERKNEFFPRNQPSSFHDDARVLNERIAGLAFRFGEEESDHLHLFHLDREKGPNIEKAVIEVFLRGIEPGVRDAFRRAARHDESFRGACEALGAILPGYDVDDHVFDPAGYSLNGLLEDRYFAVHVTPQPLGSHVGFETNHRFRDAPELYSCLGRLLGVFRPLSVNIVTFDLEHPLDLAGHGLDLRHRVVKRLPCGYEVCFLGAHRSRSGMPRVAGLPVPVAPVAPRGGGASA